MPCLPGVLEDQTQMVPSPVVKMDPSQEAQGPMVLKEPTLMFQYPVVPEVCNLVEPHPKLPTSPVVSVLVKESVTVRVTLPEPPVNPVTPKKGSHVSRAISSEPVLIPDPRPVLSVLICLLQPRRAIFCAANQSCHDHRRRCCLSICIL